MDWTDPCLPVEERISIARSRTDVSVFVVSFADSVALGLFVACILPLLFCVCVCAITSPFLVIHDIPQTSGFSCVAEVHQDLLLERHVETLAHGTTIFREMITDLTRCRSDCFRINLKL